MRWVELEMARIAGKVSEVSCVPIDVATLLVRMEERGVDPSTLISYVARVSRALCMCMFCRCVYACMFVYCFIVCCIVSLLHCFTLQR